MMRFNDKPGQSILGCLVGAEATRKQTLDGESCSNKDKFLFVQIDYPGDGDDIFVCRISNLPIKIA